jgi:acyl carrier protein phosphodiesterase
MNFLAHIYLSNNNENILIGNYIADAIKGNKYLNYPSEIQQGILLHRAIDYFTDNHPITKKSKRRLHAQYGHYKGVIIDIFYDHFLAKNWHNYSKVNLTNYTENVYALLEKNKNTFPEKVQKMLISMVKYNWLVNYASLEGIEQVLIGMNNRSKGISKMDLAIEDLKINYIKFENDFIPFFQELIQFSNAKTETLKTL